ncbi:MAG: translation initiation factor IF-1 [Verrucomicrobiota bacterium]|nr:translation initiation factor IF-1 [Limisphaera sp.]MDW8382698.1 translation initiation factor IF-1 [Verrucomicrobiota bacterium]
MIAPLGPGVYRARLPNGHELVAFVRGRARLRAPQWQPGDRLRVTVSAYDLSCGRIEWNEQTTQI